MILTAAKSRLNGTVHIPGSKSHTIRAIAIASLAHGTSKISNPLYSSDTLSAVECYRALGANINTDNPQEWIVEGMGGVIKNQNVSIDVGNSGTTLRIAAGSATLTDPTACIKLTGDHQIQGRPIEPLLRSLEDLGAKASADKNNGCAPITISGSLKGGYTSIECFTSQYLTSLVMCCPLAKQDTVIDIPLLNEPDYVQITFDWLDKQGIRYENHNLKKVVIPGGQQYKCFAAPIAADFSSATFFLCAAAILGDEITLTGLDFSDSQPDKAVADYLKQMGAEITITDSGTTVKRKSLKGIEIDMNRTPDALPAMAVTACFAEGTTKLVNVPQARKKETDRIACMAAELTKMGAHIEELPDGMIITNKAPLKPAQVKGHHDHRIVMAMSLAGMALNEPTQIDTAEAMNVTFPEYVQLMTQLGANLNMQ